jgi:hypothetical protein
MSAGCGQGLVAHHYLHHTGGIPKIKKRDPTMIATAGHPASQGQWRSGIFGTQRAGAASAHHGLHPFR